MPAGRLRHLWHSWVGQPQVLLGGVIVYFDGSHFTRTYAHLLTPFWIRLRSRLQVICDVSALARRPRLRLGMPRFRRPAG